MLIIDEEEAKVVRYIYDWYLEGYSIGRIIDKLAEKKIKTSKAKSDGVKEQLNLYLCEKSILEMWQLQIPVDQTIVI